MSGVEGRPLSSRALGVNNEIVMEKITRWIVDTSPWIEYKARLDLLQTDPKKPEVKEAKAKLISHPSFNPIIQELLQWPGDVLKNHKSAGHPLHKLVFLADVGFHVSDPQISDIVDRIMTHQDEMGLFQVLMNIHPRYGGTGEDEWSWALCDAPLIVYALANFGLEGDQRVVDALTYLIDLVRDNGWPCAVSNKLGKFRGPGRKDDPCPYANLVMLKALSQFDEMRGSDASRKGVHAILTLWEERRDRHPYMFYMGTDFSKLKAPLIWYDILHITDVLSQFPWARDDERLSEMVEIIDKKVDKEGRFTPESIWTAWKEWDFGQKKAPSPYLTYIVQRMKLRLT